MNYIEFISNLNLFKERLEKNIENYNKNFKIELEISVIQGTSNVFKQDMDLCIAMVKSNATMAQCSRKKKFGEFCGLHNNMTTGSVSTIYSTSKAKHIANKYTLEIEIKELVKEQYSSENPYYAISYNGYDYYINCITGEVYLNTISDYENLGHISTLDIPIAIY